MKTMVSTSKFCIRVNGVTKKTMICDAFAAENDCSKISRAWKTNVELWHLPEYGEPIRLTTIIYKKV